MYSLTVKQPWATAIARFGKDVENRTRRPPAHLIGQRIAIHAGQALDPWRAFQCDGARVSAHEAHLQLWAAGWGATHGDSDVPDAGRIVATARLVGWLGETSQGAVPGFESFVATADTRSPWFTGPVGWVLADVVALPVAVGEKRCDACPFGGYTKDDGNGGCVCNADPIHGWPQPFALSAEVEAEVLRQEAAGRVA